MKLDASQDPFHVFIKGDAYVDHVNTGYGLQIREGYVDYTASKWDLRLGRQVFTWGVGDMVFINDIFPKDYDALFSGKPLEYMKKGIDAAKIGIYPSFASFELIATPFFTPNHYPDAQRFWMYDPMSSITDRDRAEPSASLKHTELAVRAYREIAGVDVSLYFYRGFSREPAMVPDNMMMPTKLTTTYPELSVYGISLQGKLLDGVVSAEAGYHDSRQNRDGSDPFIPNSNVRFLVGYQYQMWEDFTAGTQYYGQYMCRYSDYLKNLPGGYPQEDQLYSLLSIRLTQMLVHQTLKLSLFSFWNPTDRDYL